MGGPPPHAVPVPPGQRTRVRGEKNPMFGWRKQLSGKALEALQRPCRLEFHRAKRAQERAGRGKGGEAGGEQLMRIVWLRTSRA